VTKGENVKSLRHQNLLAKVHDFSLSIFSHEMNGDQHGDQHDDQRLWPTFTPLRHLY
jgi:hypothetical protein